MRPNGFLTVTQANKVREAVNSQRLWQRFSKMSEIGGRADGGVDRQALSAADGDARRTLIEWSRQAGFVCATDDIGNVFVRREGIDPTLAPIVAGSHLDSQPAGGRFDGTFGVLATLEALQAIDIAGVKSLRPIELVSWTNEEGSRFSPGMMGSSIFVGNTKLPEVLSARDQDGVTLSDALDEVLAKINDVPRRPLGTSMAAYIEPHIEQGPILEDTNSTIGLVEGVQGALWYKICVIGAQAHAGTTPPKARKDALQVAVAMIHSIKTRMAHADEAMRFTVGHFVVEPNSINTIPEKVLFTVDLRHPNIDLLQEAGTFVAALCNSMAERCEVQVSEVLRMPPVTFASGLIRLLEHATRASKLPFRHIISGAFHDAVSINSICPSAMIFIPCRGGISHSPQESVTEHDVAAATKVLSVALAELSMMDDRSIASLNY